MPENRYDNFRKNKIQNPILPPPTRQLPHSNLRNCQSSGTPFSYSPVPLVASSYRRTKSQMHKSYQDPQVSCPPFHRLQQKYTPAAISIFNPFHFRLRCLCIRPRSPIVACPPGNYPKLRHSSMHRRLSHKLDRLSVCVPPLPIVSHSQLALCPPSHNSLHTNSWLPIQQNLQ